MMIRSLASSNGRQDSLSAIAGGYRHGTGLMTAATTACPGSSLLMPRRRG
jgi:hypothetical protein